MRIRNLIIKYIGNANEQGIKQHQNVIVVLTQLIIMNL
jgi:hypothetical protein